MKKYNSFNHYLLNHKRYKDLNILCFVLPIILIPFDFILLSSGNISEFSFFIELGLIAFLAIIELLGMKFYKFYLHQKYLNEYSNEKYLERNENY